MKHIDLFSGIGGFSIALDNIFYEQENHHIFVENNPFCKAVLKKHWPNSPIISDIKQFAVNPVRNKHRPFYKKVRTKEEISRIGWKTLDGRWISGAVDILTGGFPCQPFSQAGRRKGTADDRYLWPEMFNVIQNWQPTWVIAENVRGLATKGKPKRISASVHSVIDTPIEGHSKKPDEVRRRIIQLMGDLPRLEMFARQKTEGWDVWGNEIESDIKL